MRVLCQWNILIQGGQIQEIFHRVWEKEKVSALLRHLCRFPDYTVSDILFIARLRMREDKLKSKNNYELYYSRKIGKSSYMGMEQVCEEDCHSLQGNWLSLFGLVFSPDRACLFWNCAGYYPALFCILENIIHRLYMSKRIKKTDTILNEWSSVPTGRITGIIFLITCTSKVNKVIKWGLDVQGYSCYPYIGGL